MNEYFTSFLSLQSLSLPLSLSHIILLIFPDPPSQHTGIDFQISRYFWRCISLIQHQTDCIQFKFLRVVLPYYHFFLQLSYSLLTELSGFIKPRQSVSTLSRRWASRPLLYRLRTGARSPTACKMASKRANLLSHIRFQSLRDLHEWLDTRIFLRLLERKFGPADEVTQARIKSTNSQTLLRWGERIPTAQTVKEVFEE